MSHRLLALAKADNWDDMPELEQERRKLIDACFSSDPTLSGAKHAQDKIQEIIALDKKVLEMAATAREGIGESLDKLQQGRSVTNAYQQNSR